MEINQGMLDEMFSVIPRIAKEAGEKILEIYNCAEDSTIKTKHEDDYESPLTKADLEANKIIIDNLRLLYPKIKILTEEEVDNKERLNSELLFIVDPLDGTKDFIKRTGDFTVNIALVFKKKPILGCVYVPFYEEIYIAAKGKGAFFQKNNGLLEKIKVSSEKDICDMKIVRSRSHAKPEFSELINKHRFKEVTPYGSSLKGCKIAQGLVDVYPRFGPTNEWDIAAMNCVVTEAGGMMTDFEGKELTYNNENTLNNGFLISNGKIHEQLLKICIDAKK